MTMRQRLRRRSAISEILRNLQTRPFCEDTPPASGGWLNQRRPGLRHGSPRAQSELTTRRSPTRCSRRCRQCECSEIRSAPLSIASIAISFN